MDRAAANLAEQLEDVCPTSATMPRSRQVWRHVAHAFVTLLAQAGLAREREDHWLRIFFDNVWLFRLQ
jgi:hypothetical protein